MTLPTGTVTFLFTDIQGSTPLWEHAPEKMAEALQIHNAALRKAIEANGGAIFQIVGDAFQAAFATAPQALKAAIDGQRALQSASWNELGELKVRMGLHTGEAELDAGGDEYAVSHTKNRVARIMSAAHGGQVLLSEETADLVKRVLPEGVTLKDMGEHHLKGLEWLEHLYQVVASGVEQNFPSLKSETRPNHNLPLELTPFIGRQIEIVQVQELLRRHRLVTLTGSGGVGKTRLALQVARASLEEFPDGVWFVELAPLTDPSLLPYTVAMILGLREEPNRSMSETVSNFLYKRQALLILDNCEHLLNACAQLADTLLRQSAQIRIFCSSRENLGLTGEYAMRVPSLTTPDLHQMPPVADLQEFEAVRLFTERVRAVLPAFQIDEQNALSITKICQRLDGIPLALELAAARINLLTTEQLASRLDNAFRLLTGGSRMALPRQQTLRAAIDWSYQLLSAPEQRLLRRLAVFIGGGTLQSIEGICAGEGLETEQILDLLSGLVNKSIVNVERKQHKETRYWLLETVRQFTREKLYEAGESTLFYDRFFTYFLEMAEAIEPQMRTAAALERLDELNREFDNLRAALSWALEGEGNQKIEAGLRLAIALLELWHSQSFHSEGYSWLMKGLSAFTGDGPSLDGIRAKAYYTIGHLILPIGRQEEARQFFIRSLDIFQRIGDIRGSIMAQSMLGEVLAWLHVYDEAEKQCEASLATCRSFGDTWLFAWALCRLGLCYLFHGVHTRARPCLEESLAIFEKMGDKLQVSDLYIMLGIIAFDRGEYIKSENYHTKCLTFGRARKSKWTEANSLDNLGKIAYMQGDFDLMKVYLEESVALNRETGNYLLYHTLVSLGTAELHLAHPIQAQGCFKECLQSSRESWIATVSLIGTAGAALQIDQPQTAAQLLGAVKRLLEGEILKLEVINQKEYELAWLAAKERLGESTFEAAISKGEAMTLEQAVAYALKKFDS